MNATSIKGPGTAAVGQGGVTVRPKLVKKSSSGSDDQTKAGGKGVADARNEKLTPMGRGRGRRLDLITPDLPSGAVAAMIHQNLGQGHRLSMGASRSAPSSARKSDSRTHQATNSNNNNSHFPTFDYKSLSKSPWWADSIEVTSAGSGRAPESKETCSNQEKMRQQEKVVVQKAVLSGWTPLDDSV